MIFFHISLIYYYYCFICCKFKCFGPFEKFYLKTKGYDKDIRSGGKSSCMFLHDLVRSSWWDTVVMQNGKTLLAEYLSLAGSWLTSHQKSFSSFAPIQPLSAKRLWRAYHFIHKKIFPFCYRVTGWRKSQQGPLRICATFENFISRTTSSPMMGWTTRLSGALNILVTKQNNLNISLCIFITKIKNTKVSHITQIDHTSKFTQLTSPQHSKTESVLWMVC